MLLSLSLDFNAQIMNISDLSKSLLFGSARSCCSREPRAGSMRVAAQCRRGEWKAVGLGLGRFCR